MARTQAVTILFCDLVSSTERRARLGDDAFDAFTRRFMGELRGAISDANGREVSSAGDGLMVVFPESVADALACAAAMHTRVAALDTDDPPRLRIGISCGEVAQDGNEYSGMPIVEAARLEAAATPGRTLASAVVRSLVGTRRAFRFRDVGALSLKGIPNPLATVEVVADDVVDVDVDIAAGGDSVSAARASAVRPEVARGPTAPRPPARRRSTRRIVVAIAVVVVLVAVGVGVAVGTGGSGGSNATARGVPKPVGYTPKLESTTCPSDVHAADADATCSHLVVPQDRSKPQGKQVSLLVTRAAARVPVAAGVAPTIDICGCESVGNSVTRDHSPLIQVSQRGWGGSDPVLACPEVSAERSAALLKKANDPAEIANGAAALGQCHDRLVRAGIDPAQYNAKAAAADVLDLMYALHLNRADFTASGDSSVELFEIMHRAPGAVRSMTIDNPTPPGQSTLTDPVADLAGAFKRYVAACNLDQGCTKNYPNLDESWRAAYAQFDAQPKVVVASDPDSSNPTPTPVLFDGPRAADALAAALADPGTYHLIPAAITLLNSPTAAAVRAGEVVRSDRDSFYPDGALWGTRASYICSYDVNTQTPSVLALEANTLPQFTRGWPSVWGEWCKAWKVPNVYDALSADVAGPVPALLFRGDLNPVGNPQWLRQVQRGLSRDQSVVFPTLGSGLLAGGPPCLSVLRRSFLAHPTSKLDTAACAKKSPAIDFVTSG